MRRIVALFLVASVGLVAACTDDEPRAAKQGQAPRGPFGAILAYAAAGSDTVFVVTDVAGCATCATLWRWEAHRPDWKRVHDFGVAEKPFTDETLKYPPINPWGLAMAADGRHGYISWDAEGLQQTDDGGRTWRPVEIPDARGAVGAGSPVVTGQHALLLVPEECEAEDCGPGVLWRTRLGTDTWERVDQPPGYYFGFGTSGRTVLVEATVLGGERLFRTTDAAGAWSEVRTPRNTAAGSVGHCAPFATGASTSVVSCLRAPDGLHVVRTSDDGGRTWRDVLTLGTYQHAAEYPDQVVAIGGERILVATAKRTVLVDRAGHLLPVETPPRAVTAGTCTDDRTCVVMAAGDRLWRTTDAGTTWRVISRGSTRSG